MRILNHLLTFPNLVEPRKKFDLGMHIGLVTYWGLLGRPLLFSKCHHSSRTSIGSEASRACIKNIKDSQFLSYSTYQYDVRYIYFLLFACSKSRFYVFFLFFTNYALHLWCTLINRRCCVSEKMCKQQFFFPSPILMILTKVMVGDQKLNKLLFSSSVSPPEFETLGQKKIQIQLSLSKQ